VKRSSVLPFAVLMLAAGACSSSSSLTVAPTAVGTTAAPPSPVDTATSAPPPSPTGACVTQYFPAVSGVTRTYTIKTSKLGTSKYTQHIGAVTDTGFTTTNEFRGIRSTAKYSCSAEGITALDVIGGPAGTVSLQGSEVSYKTTNIQGVTYPATIATGDSWTQSFTIAGKQRTGGSTTETTGTITIDFHASGGKHVTVGAGGYDAIAVYAVVQFDLTQTIDAGTPIPLSSAFRETLYLVDGVGLVKEVGSGSILGVDINSNMELANSTA
jgi:hypothetical protein